MRLLILTMVFGAACLVSVSQLYRSWRQFSRPPDATLQGPGEFAFTAPVTGDYTLWHKLPRGGMGAIEYTSPQLPATIAIKVRKGTEELSVRPGASTTIRINGTARRSVVRFPAIESGVYSISISGISERQSFDITHGSFFRPLLQALVWLVAAVGSAVLTLVFGILAGTRRTSPNHGESPPLG